MFSTRATRRRESTLFPSSKRRRLPIPPGIDAGRAVATALVLTLSVFYAQPGLAGERVVLQLGWDHQFQFAGYYAAQWRGFYRDAGIAVEIRSGIGPGDVPVNVTEEVAEGRADFGIGSADILVERDARIPLVILASIFQESAVAFYAQKGVRLFSPVDLTRLRVARRVGDMVDVELQAMLRAEGIDPSTLTSHSIGIGIRDLVSRNIDVTPDYTITAPWYAKRLGLLLISLRPNTYGIDFYGDSLFTHERVMRRDAELVQRFLTASLRGWTYAMEHSEEIANRIAQELPRSLPLEDPVGFNQFQVEGVRRLMHYPITEPGHINPERWRRMHEHLRQAGLVSNEFPQEELIFDPSRREHLRHIRLLAWLTFGLSAVLFIAVASLIWTRMLRKTVSTRTAALQESEAKFKDFAEMAADWFWEMGPDLRFTFVSGKYEEITGLSQAQILGRTRNEVYAGQMIQENHWQAHLKCLEMQHPFERFQYEWRRSDGKKRILQISGKPVFSEKGVFKGYRGAGRNITEEHHLTQQLTHQATHDTLTGVVNRREFQRRLDHAVAAARSQNIPYSLCYLDLDGFKSVNDRAGHQAGDVLLQQVAALLTSRLRSRDTLARIGGDEFGLLLENCPLQKALEVVEVLVAQVRGHDFSWEGFHFVIGLSVGVIAIDQQSESATRMLAHSDRACFEAKQRGGGQVQAYVSSSETLRRREMLRASDIREALANDRFVLFAQPIIPLLPGKSITYWEILLRLLTPEDTVLLPDDFVPIAEKYGLMPECDRWVIRTALQAFGESIGNLPDDGMSINVSGNSLNDDSLPEFVEGVLSATGVPPERICFEITETAAVSNLTHATKLITDIREMGCHFALDDFGRGSSSLTYLRHLPVDWLKIDGSFVRELTENSEDRVMVGAISRLAHALGLRTVAEHVETTSILKTIESLDVDYAQGHALGEPGPLTQVGHDRAPYRMSAV